MSSSTKSGAIVAELAASAGTRVRVGLTGVTTLGLLAVISGTIIAGGSGGCQALGRFIISEIVNLIKRNQNEYS